MRWFQVDSNMPSDPKMIAVARAHGLAGTGALVYLWCFVARHGSLPGKSIDAAGRAIPCAFLRAAAGFGANDEKEFDSLINTLIEVAHIDGAEWRDSGVLVFPAMARRADYYTKYGKHVENPPTTKSLQRDYKESTKNISVQRVQRVQRVQGGKIAPGAILSAGRKNRAKRGAILSGGDPFRANGRSYRRILQLAHDVIAVRPKAQLARLKLDLHTLCAQAHLPRNDDLLGRALESALAANGRRP